MNHARRVYRLPYLTVYNSIVLVFMTFEPWCRYTHLHDRSINGSMSQSIFGLNPRIRKRVYVLQNQIYIYIYIYIHIYIYIPRIIKIKAIWTLNIPEYKDNETIYNNTCHKVTVATKWTITDSFAISNVNNNIDNALNVKSYCSFFFCLL